MLRHSLFAAALFAATLFSFLQPADAQRIARSRAASTLTETDSRHDYFPLREGDSWTYAVDGIGSDGQQVTVRVAGVEEIDGVRYYRLEGYPFASSALIFANGSGLVFEYLPEENRRRLWYNFGQRSWQPDTGDACLGEATVVADRRGPLETPAGTFDETLTVEYGPTNCADAGVERQVFAPGIGLVQHTEITIAGPRTLTLVRAEINGLKKEQPGLRFSIEIDRPLYTPNLMPPVDPDRAIPTLNARVVLENRSNAPLKMTFPTPQFFDLEIRNADGETVYFWSATRLFAAVVTDLELSPGQEVFEVSVPLSMGEEPFEPGQYVVEGWLVQPAGRLYSASVPFEVTEPAY